MKESNDQVLEQPETVNQVTEEEQPQEKPLEKPLEPEPKEEDIDTQEGTPSPEDEKKAAMAQNTLSEISTEADSQEPKLPSKHILEILFDFLRTDEE